MIVRCQRGQITVEYALATVVFVAVLIAMVNMAEPLIFGRWVSKTKYSILTTIGSDVTSIRDEIKQR